MCCDNTKYCFVNSTNWEPQCCPVGSSCGEQCGTERYYGNKTITTTISSSVTVQTSQACLGRKCVSSFYQCPSSMGGGCCGFGSDCGSPTVPGGTGICIGTTTSSTSVSAIASTLPSGCTVQGQTSCEAGGGCCDAGYACTLIDSSPWCSRTTAAATTTPAPTASGVTAEHQSQGLSSGAKAGIAVGVVALAALVIGAATWVCVRRRRGAKSTTTAQEMDTNPDRAGAGTGGARRDGDSQTGSVLPYGADSGPHMSEADGYSYSHGYAPSSTQVSNAEGRLTSDYFGPGIVAAGAPYYAQHHAGGDYEQQQSQRTVSPEYAVEIGTRDSMRRQRSSHTRMSSQDSGDGSQSELADTSSAQLARGGSMNRHEAAASSMRDSIAGRFELYGDGGDVAASPAAVSERERGREVYHDAPERRIPASSSGLLPQPFPTPGSERSEYATPSPMSREEPEQRLRREV